ncbi:MULTISPECIES: hypothetical protein [unclassified Crossiella]|uniref:hypothetical protein n=1 Tax=unclassified Crossiella TaxID=2620835 RepID=UPI0020003D2C|nr:MULTISPECIES: hypothetical protein [unclassified Crossiella]MCK2241149.1 hypothetical protein [Crossiella sp. S99.2]MCK2253707.1 hypothetical protein [Crossiella sp. S99.1]
MARRSPSQVRTDPPRRAHRAVRPEYATPPALARLSPRGRVSLARLERTKLWPVTANEVLLSWQRFLRDPIHRLWDTSTSCGVLMCCPDPDELRRMLSLIAAQLPTKDARMFRQHLARLDELW